MTIHSSLGATLAALISNTCVEAIAMIAATDELVHDLAVGEAQRSLIAITTIAFRRPLDVSSPLYAHLDRPCAMRVGLMSRFLTTCSCISGNTI